MSFPKEVSVILRWVLPAVNLDIDLARFIAEPSYMRPVTSGMALGITITMPTSADPVHTKEEYGTLSQLVISYKGSFEAFDWDGLHAALSTIVHPLDVDFISLTNFADDQEAEIRAHLPGATVRLHTESDIEL